MLGSPVGFWLDHAQSVPAVAANATPYAGIANHSEDIGGCIKSSEFTDKAVNSENNARLRFVTQLLSKSQQTFDLRLQPQNAVAKSPNKRSLQAGTWFGSSVLKMDRIAGYSSRKYHPQACRLSRDSTSTGFLERWPPTSRRSHEPDAVTTSDINSSVQIAAGTVQGISQLRWSPGSQWITPRLKTEPSKSQSTMSGIMLACSLRLPHLAHRRVDMWPVQVVEIRNSLQELYYCEYHARLTAVTSAELQKGSLQAVSTKASKLHDSMS